MPPQDPATPTPSQSANMPIAPPFEPPAPVPATLPAQPAAVAPVTPANQIVNPAPQQVPIQPPVYSQIPGPAAVPQPMQLNPAYGHDKLVIASLILGVISLPASLLNLLTLPIPVIGIVLGLVGFKRNKGMAIAGIVLSSIGLVLSIVIFAVGVHIYQNRDTTINRLPDSSNSEDTTSTKGSTLSAPCYSFTLPEPLKAADIAENTDCVTTIVNTNSTEDIGVNSSAPATAVTEADTDTYLKAVAAQAKSLVVGKDGSVTAEGFTILDGSRAYKVLGTQNTGHYKYFGYIIALAPREYTSSAGDKLQAFIIASDSATSPNRLDEVVQSWQWQ